MEEIMNIITTNSNCFKIDENTNFDLITQYNITKPLFSYNKLSTNEGLPQVKITSVVWPLINDNDNAILEKPKFFSTVYGDMGKRNQIKILGKIYIRPNDNYNQLPAINSQLQPLVLGLQNQNEQHTVKKVEFVDETQKIVEQKIVEQKTVEQKIEGNFNCSAQKMKTLSDHRCDLIGKIVGWLL